MEGLLSTEDSPLLPTELRILTVIFIKLFTTGDNEILMLLLKVKPSLDRSGKALRFRGFKISRQSTHEGGKVVISTHRPPLPQGDHLYLFLLGTVSNPGPYCGWKDSMENSNNPIRSRNRELTVCSTIDQFKRVRLAGFSSRYKVRKYAPKSLLGKPGGKFRRANMGNIKKEV